ncbi:MAG TPA: hypothetical protein VFM30_10335 [Steroidobacteraceae bacterium]|nr:hypothetical protein [Steroidobacteraceae bacterium]
MKATIKRMLDAGELRKAGERRGTRYFPPGAGRLPGGAKTKGRRRAAKKTARKVRPSATIKPARRLAKGATRRTAIVPAGAIARPTTDVPEALAAR